MFSRSLLCSTRLSVLPPCNNVFGTTIQAAGLRFFPPPIKYDIETPPDTRGKKLSIQPKVPQYPPQMRPFKMQKKLKFMRGPELVLNKLLHKQYGVIALVGGRMRYGHFEMVRWTCGRKLPEKAFSLWRVDAPWQPVTKKGAGQRMGGGKGSIDHYVTPVKAGRVIIEVGGPLEYAEVKKTLEEVAHKLPFPAMAVSQEMLDQMEENERYKEEHNENPYTMKYIIQNNLGGCHNWISPIDKLYFGKYT
ncbi:39S ribosomal protein L16, mitochondrial [Nasonia vitripennis]|uniref:Large ribosomal subunit protein uL16m n=1 Tax=Nasonia vitripennis TaxID=7425 RepID=A0A7M7GHQ0_NASVI|nr:39S ribosomal protein L16, mitochondrial [Nasonia vitripennis]